MVVLPWGLSVIFSTLASAAFALLVGYVWASWERRRGAVRRQKEGTFEAVVDVYRCVQFTVADIVAVELELLRSPSVSILPQGFESNDWDRSWGDIARYFAVARYRWLHDGDHDYFDVQLWADGVRVRIKASDVEQYSLIAGND